MGDKDEEYIDLVEEHDPKDVFDGSYTPSKKKAKERPSQPQGSAKTPKGSNNKSGSKDK